MEGAEEIVDDRLLVAVPIAVVLDRPGRPQDPGDVHELPGVQAAPHVGSLEGAGHRPDAAEGGTAPEDHHVHRGGGLLQPLGHLVGVGLRAEFPGPALALLGDRLGGQQLQNLGQFQCMDGFLK